MRSTVRLRDEWLASLATTILYRGDEHRNEHGICFGKSRRTAKPFGVSAR